MTYAILQNLPEVALLTLLTTGTLVVVFKFKGDHESLVVFTLRTSLSWELCLACLSE